MCSMDGGRLGEICRAIDELAARGDGAAQVEAARPERRDDADLTRLAAIWAMVAAADPELAKRLPGYLSAAE
jgi:hypothetical protein